MRDRKPDYGLDDDTAQSGHHTLCAAPCRPFEDEGGDIVFEYDKPSTLFGQFGDERVTEVGRYFDWVLEVVLVKTAGQMLLESFGFRRA